jgi:hypothetical protein
MHFNSLRHVRDHAKVTGTARQLLQEIALHVNYHTGEAFDLTVERLAHHLAVTPQWVGQLKAGLVATGELLVKQSRGRHPNVYLIPWEHCAACRGDDQAPDDLNPKVEKGDDLNPKVAASQPPTEPQSGPASTPKCDPANPKVEGAFEPELARIELPKEVKDLKDLKEGETPNLRAEERDKPERRSRFWCEPCGFAIPTCVHRVVEVTVHPPSPNPDSPSGPRAWRATRG